MKEPWLFVGNPSGVLERAERLLAQEAFPPDDQVAWEKGPGRIEPRRLKGATVTPEESGLCGCWQVLAGRRERIELGPQAGPPSDAMGYSSTSVAETQLSKDDLLTAIRDHWQAIDTGTHDPQRSIPSPQRTHRDTKRKTAVEGAGHPPGETLRPEGSFPRVLCVFLAFFAAIPTALFRMNGAT
jgi:hypothetical protein